MESSKIIDSRKERTNNEEDWDTSDYVDIEEEEDSEEEDEYWDEEDEDWEKEMEKLSKVE